MTCEQCGKQPGPNRKRLDIIKYPSSVLKKGEGVHPLPAPSEQRTLEFCDSKCRQDWFDAQRAARVASSPA